MPPLDWDKVMAADVNDIGDDDSDSFFEMLTKYKPSDVDDVGKLRQLFLVSRAVMNSKNEQGEEAIGMMEKEAKEFKKREKELLAEQDKLEKQLKDVQRFGADEGGGGVTSRDTRYIREELQSAEDQNRELKAEITDLQRDLSNEKRAAEKYSERISELEKESKDMRQDNDQMRQDLTDLKTQLMSQGENLKARRGEDLDVRKKMMKKNRELSEMMEDLQNLTDVNDELEKRCKALQSDLEEASLQMERNTEEYLKLKAVVQQSDTVIDNLRQENGNLKIQVADLSDQVQNKTDADDAIMVAVNNKIEEWKALLTEKDQQLLEYQEQVYKLREQLIASHMDSDKASVAALSKVVKDKDKQIEEMSEQITQYISEAETNAALVEDLRIELHKSGSGPGDRHQLRIRELQKEVEYLREQLKTVDTSAKQADEDAKAKDKHLCEALERMQQYESGEYGLAEAVAEIKEYKNQVKTRDRKVEELTQHVNRAEMKINDLLDENEELRYKLKMDPKEPLDLNEFRKNKNIRKEEEKALNFVLQREVERLEEERLELKKKIRKLAKNTGKRAVDLGLTAEDMLIAQEHQLAKETMRREDTIRSELGPTIITETEEVTDIKQKPSAGTLIRRAVEREEYKLRAQQVDKDYMVNLKKLDEVQGDHAAMKAKVIHMEEENKHLEQALKEVAEALKKSKEGADTDPLNQFPSIDRMLAAIEAKHVIGNYDTSLYLKAQVDNLQGRNDEIRSQFRESRHENNKLMVQLDKALEKINLLEQELKNAEESGSGGQIAKAIALPEGMTATSSEVIASLNEHLVTTLHELNHREEIMKKMEVSLDNYRRKYAVLRHQQKLLYEDYINEKKEFTKEKDKLEESLRSSEGLRETDKVRLDEFDRLCDTLSKDDVEVRRRLSEMTRRITVLRVNEKALTRRYTTKEEIEGTLRQEIQKLRNDNAAIEIAVKERIGYLQRYKDMSAFKMAALLKKLDDSVPSSDLDDVSKKFHQLTEKYRDLLEKGNNLVSKAESIGGLEDEVKRLTVDNEEMKRLLSIEKEKLHTLEAALEDLQKRGITDGAEMKGVSDGDIISISKKITTLEMKELNERQRAEHAVRICDQQKQISQSLELRNQELEEKFAETTKMNLELQKVERELRDELTNSVTKAISDADRKKIAELEEMKLALEQEISKLKEVSEVANTQVGILETRHVSQEKELTSLRQQLLDFQVQSDEKTIIGKLHRHIVQLQVSEGTAVRRLAEADKKNSKLQALLLRLEQKIDSKDQTFFHSRTEAQNKIKYLKRSLQEIRLQFAGAIPLAKQERFSNSMLQLQQNKNKIEQELKKVTEQKSKMEDKLAELELSKRSLQELIATLKDGKGAAKVLEWHDKMDKIRLDELKQKRQISKLLQREKYLEGLFHSHEITIADLEAENVRLVKESEERQLRWEQREVELERNIENLERQANEIAGAASTFEEAVGSLPDSNKPVAHQLEQAITTIKKNVKIILDTQAESKQLKQKYNDVYKQLRETEQALIARDKLISELRLRMPATAERDEIIMKATSKINTAMNERNTVTKDYESEQSTKVAQSTINSLKQRIQQKEVTIQKYGELLSQARDDMQEMNKRHEGELIAMQQKMHKVTDDAFSKFKESAKEMLNKQSSNSFTDKQLARLSELEDMVAEQDNAMAVMSEKIRIRDEQIAMLKTKIHGNVKDLEREKDRLMEECKSELVNKDMEKEDLVKHINDQKKEIEILIEEINALKETNSRAPTTTMKNLVERLKNQVALKEKQHQALTKALTELKADMVNQAEDNVRAQADGASQEINIQKLIDKHTKELTDQIEDLQSQIDRLKKELRKRKETESTLHSDLEDVREDLSRKERTVHKLKADKQRLEQEVDELEKKAERLGAIRGQRSGDDSMKNELEELRRRNRLLEDDLRRKTHVQQAEKPYEHKETLSTLKEHKPKTEEVTKWEEVKKWQRTAEKMKVRLKDRDHEIEKLQKSNEMMKNAMDRAVKEKETLEIRMRKDAKIMAAPTTHHVSVPPTKEDHNMEALRQKNYQLHEEINSLRRQLAMNRDAAFNNMQLRNNQLSEQLEELERALAHKRLSDKDQGVGLDEYQRIYDKNQDLQKEVLKNSEENIELRFEVEQCRKDVPRLKERIEDLQRYVDALKMENAQLQNSSGEHSARSFLSNSSIRRIGESGKSTRELEKTVALLKKVVERVQFENEQLKKAPGVLGNEEIQNLRRENDGLKSQLEDLRQKMGLTLSERYVSKEKGTAKMMQDYEKMRKDFMKEMETNEKLRVDIRNLEMQKDKLTRDLKESKARLEIEGSKKQTSQSIEPQGWKSAVVTRMYEEKMKGMESDVGRNKKLAYETKELLTEAAEREQSLLQEREELIKKISILERFPTGSYANDTDLMRDYQQSRLTMERLENEKKELLNHVRLLTDSGLGPEELVEELLSKATKHDKLMTENIEQQLQTKALVQERDKLKLEVQRMKKELANFGPEFFEEIEDLKYNYKESIQRNVLYEDKLKQVSAQFGISINLPGFSVS